MIPVREKINPLDFGKLETEKQKLEFILKYGVLAPSTRNTQPWFFRIKEDSIFVYPNLKRHLPLSDPQQRQVYLSVGTAIENITLALRSYGLSFNKQFIEEDNKMVCIIKVENYESDQKSDHDTLKAIIERHNNREYFTDKELPLTFVEWLKNLSTNSLQVDVVTNGEKKDQIKEIVGKATKVAFTNKPFLKEASQWVRPSLAKYKDGMPGYNMGIPKIISMFLPFLVKNIDMSNVQVKLHKKWVDKSAAVVTISSPEDTELDWINAGSLFEKIAIEATKQGINIAVMAAPIEVNDYYKQLAQILDTSNRPQMFFRLGYAEMVTTPSPRLPLSEVLK